MARYPPERCVLLSALPSLTAPPMQGNHLIPNDDKSHLTPFLATKQRHPIDAGDHVVCVLTLNAIAGSLTQWRLRSGPSKSAAKSGLPGWRRLSRRRIQGIPSFGPCEPGSVTRPDLRRPNRSIRQCLDRSSCDLTLGCFEDTFTGKKAPLCRASR